MYAEKLSPLIRKFPQDAEALRRMERYLSDFEIRRANQVASIRLNPNRMFDILQAGSNSRLARVISILIEGKVFRRQLLVRLPGGNGVTFPSYSDLPKIVRDPARDIEVEVSQENIEATYILVTNEPS